MKVTTSQPGWKSIHTLFMLFARWSFSTDCTHPWIQRQIRGKTCDTLKQRYELMQFDKDNFSGNPTHSGRDPNTTYPNRPRT